ncbi:MAG: PQQ-dependent sugar dehydrogenase [Bacteroidota bacterium]
MRLTIRLSFFFLVLACSTSFQHEPGALSIRIKLIAEGFTGPVVMESPKDGSGRLFICEQTGKIKIIKNGKVLSKPFLDVSSKLDGINKMYSEKGLLGMAFHPQYKTNGRFFIYYSAPSAQKSSDHKSILAEYKVSADADIADAASAKVIMEIEQPESNHNGGQLAFGPDGFLYIGLGDGGGGGDEHGSIGNGQDLTTWLGKILRIDVNGKSPYAVPKDNPFVNDKNAKPEIWAYGLRNPWRFSFDRSTGRLFCADVGQNKWEEIDIIEKGKNYGWRIMEGNHCYNPSENCNTKGLAPPIAEYDHGMGISVTGGYVYRGKDHPSLSGKYIFGDWKGNMYYLEEASGKWKLHDLVLEDKKDNDLGININSFGEDEQGELYILAQKFTGTFAANGAVYLISGK